MNSSTVFLGGSRQVSRLSAQVKDRLNNVIESHHRVIVGDANGADKAIQRHLSAAGYDNVTVFCSGDQPRNNLGQWRIQRVFPPKNVKGFQFYAAKDREMARQADFGLMIWDSKSAGTVLNILRLVRAGKFAVLINEHERSTINIKSRAQWDKFLMRCPPKLLANLRERATADEYDLTTINPQANLFETKAPKEVLAAKEELPPSSEDDLAATLNAALATGDPASVVDALGGIARVRGMTQVSKDSGLARESLYRSLTADGNPEFATVLKVLIALGMRLEVHDTRTLETA